MRRCGRPPGAKSAGYYRRRRRAAATDWRTRRRPGRGPWATYAAGERSRRARDFISGLAPAARERAAAGRAPDPARRGTMRGAWRAARGTIPAGARGC